MIICVCGPTGIGKTRLSIYLAKKYNAIVINADATQIYKELNIGSAKIKESEKEGVSHYLFDIKSPDEDYSVMEYQKDARKLLNENKDKNIIVVGGTGLYIKALFYDYKFSKKDSILYADKSNDELYNLALKKDENMKIDKNNRVRLINFLNRENEEKNGDQLLYDVHFIGLTTSREKIYSLVNNRVEKMINEGLENEVRLLYKKYPNSNILKRAIGYKEIIEYINGNISLEEAIDLIKKNTRHYVKRQYTWFNNKLDVKYFETNFENFHETEESVSAFIDSLNSK